MQNSSAEDFRALPIEERRRRLDVLSDEELAVVAYDWAFWRRPNQTIPDGDWTTWLILAGRGYGKSRTGAETVREWARGSDLVNLIGATADDARDIMIEGESGILACCPNGERPAYHASKRQLLWPNGSKSLIFTADEPERLRGKQHQKLWCDELASWRYPEAWDQARLGLRLGARPQAVVTTTPKPTKIVKELLADSTTHVTRGTTYENRSNLAPAFFSAIITKYEGTRMGRQELKAEILDDNPNALWTRANIDDHRIKLEALPQLVRVVVGVDPSATSNEDSDECGIVSAGRDGQYPPHFYVLSDRSLIASPNGWARIAVTAYAEHKADRVIGEANNGGDMIEAVIRNVDANVSYKKVTATRGKMIRAEPIAALYEQGRVHHVGFFPQLEDQLCEYDPTTAEKSPDRLDADVWALTELSDQDGTGLLDYYRQMAERQKGAA